MLNLMPQNYMNKHTLSKYILSVFFKTDFTLDVWFHSVPHLKALINDFGVLIGQGPPLMTQFYCINWNLYDVLILSVIVKINMI